MIKTLEPMMGTLPNTDQPRILHSKYRVTLWVVGVENVYFHLGLVRPPHVCVALGKNSVHGIGLFFFGTCPPRTE